MINLSLPLQHAIESYENWSSPFAFHEFVLNHPKLNDNDREQLKLVWSDATDVGNWQNCDLILGCKITQNRLSNNYDLSEQAIGAVVRAASYEWK